MASNNPSQCCTVANVHEGTPRGIYVKIDGKIDAYLSLPPDISTPRHGVLIVPDIFGIWQNSKLLADGFAAEGFACLIPDIFNGDQLPLDVPASFNIMNWLAEGTGEKNPHGVESIDPIIVAGIKHLQQLGCTYIVGAGYCLGAKYVIRHFKDGIQCGFVAHPSFVESQELAAISGPLSIAAAENDEIFPAEKRHESETILAETSLDYQLSLFSGVEHGFAIRGDSKDEKVRFGKEQAFKQAVAWFNKFSRDD